MASKKRARDKQSYHQLGTMSPSHMHQTYCQARTPDNKPVYMVLEFTLLDVAELLRPDLSSLDEVMLRRAAEVSILEMFAPESIPPKFRGAIGKRSDIIEVIMNELGREITKDEFDAAVAEMTNPTMVVRSENDMVTEVKPNGRKGTDGLGQPSKSRRRSPSGTKEVKKRK